MKGFAYEDREGRRSERRRKSANRCRECGRTVEAGRRNFARGVLCDRCESENESAALAAVNPVHP